MVMHVDGMVKITIMGQTKILYLFIYWVCHSQMCGNVFVLVGGFGFL